MSDFLNHLGIKVEGDIVAKLDKPTAERAGKGNRLSENGKKTLEDILISGKYSASKAVDKLFALTGERASSATAYSMRSRLRKEGRMS